MNGVQCGCLTYKYSLIAVILVLIICTLSMSLLVSLASTVPTTVNNRFRFSHDVLRRRILGEFQRDCKIVKRKCIAVTAHNRPSDRRNMDREQFIVFFFLLISRARGYFSPIRIGRITKSISQSPNRGTSKSHLFDFNTLTYFVF